MNKCFTLLLALFLTGCFLTDQPPTFIAPTVTPTGIEDASVVMRGICFEAAFDAAGQLFVLRSDGDLARFYDLADHSELCRRPVERASFDFSGRRVLAGLWSKGIGCKARHEVLSTQRDDVAKTMTITLQFVTEGDCPYELVRPYWIALDGVMNYNIAIEVLS